MANILLIVNPASGKYDPEKIEKIKSILENNNHNITVSKTNNAGHGEVLAKNANEEVVIACGGDGIINEVARGIYKTEKSFYAIPLGTANVFCQEYGIGKNPYKAARKLNPKNVHKIPAGFVQNKFFLLMVGFGFDAHIVKKVEEGFKYPVFLKKTVHFVHSLPSLIKDKYPKLKLCFNNETIPVFHVIFSLVEKYAGNFKLGDINRKKINAFYVTQEGKFAIFKSFAPLFLNQGFKGGSSQSDTFKIKGAKICQIDGEFVKLDKNEEVEISFSEDAINFLMPEYINQKNILTDQIQKIMYKVKNLSLTK